MTEQVPVKSETIDEEENAFFGKLSCIWWDMADLMNELHYAGAVTFKYIKNTLAANKVEESGSVKIVDVGCGGGIISEAMTKRGYTVVGIDVNEDLLQAAKEHAALDKNLTNLTYHLTTVEQYASENPEKYDVVILSFVLQHVKQHKIIISNSVKLLKPGGLIFITAVGKTFKSFVTIKLIREQIKRIAPVNSHRWRNFINCHKVEEILYENGCTVINHSGMRSKKFGTAWRLYDGLEVFYILHATKNVV